MILFQRQQAIHPTLPIMKDLVLDISRVESSLYHSPLGKDIVLLQGGMPRKPTNLHDENEPSSADPPLEAHQRRNISRRDSWPPKVPVSERGESLRPLTLSPLTSERGKNVVHSETTKSVTYTKGKCSSPPTIRSAPNDLWHVVRNKSLDSVTITPTCSPVQAFPQAHSLISDARPMKETAPEHDPTSYIPSERWHATSDERMQVEEEDDIPGLLSSPSTWLLTQPLSLPVKHSIAPHVAHRYTEIVSIGRRSNPHAAVVPSRFNPMRDQFPAHIWSVIHETKKTRRFTTKYQPFRRSRSFCDSSFYSIRPICYLIGDFKHCLACSKDSLHKRLLIYRHNKVNDKNVFSFYDSDDEEMILDIIGDDHSNRKESEYVFSQANHYDWDPAGRVPDSPFIQDLDDFDY